MFVIETAGKKRGHGSRSFLKLKDKKAEAPEVGSTSAKMEEPWCSLSIAATIMLLGSGGLALLLRDIKLPADDASRHYSLWSDTLGVVVFVMVIAMGAAIGVWYMTLHTLQQRSTPAGNS